MVDPEEKLGMTEGAAEREAVAAFEAVFKEGDKIVLDHYLNYYARTFTPVDWPYPIADTRVDFEYGRLLACKGEKAHAREHLELVMSGVSHQCTAFRSLS